MPRKAEDSAKAQLEQLRERMGGYGATVGQIAAEMGRRFGLRPRAAWRSAMGWQQWKLAQRYNALFPGARLSNHRVSEYEAWPHGGAKPSVRYLVRLAQTVGHGCTVSQLVDADDLEELDPADRVLLTTGQSPPPVTAGEAGAAVARQTAGGVVLAPAVSGSGRDLTGGQRCQQACAGWGGHGHTGVTGGTRRIIRCDARGVPMCEEVVMAAEESAQFWRWSATTNVDDEVLEQMSAAVADIAWSEQLDPPAVSFARLLRARDDVFGLLAGHQQPRYSTELYRLAGQLCAMLAHITFDLGHRHAADTHSRTALHCVEMSGDTPQRAYIRWVQSLVAYWAGHYDEAATLVESGLVDATRGTGQLRLTSQLARINAARRQPTEVTRALAKATPADRAADEPGVLGFDTGMAALYASEAHCALGEAENLDAAVDWARTALDEFTAQSRPRVQSFASARFNLATAYLAQGDLDAVCEHVAPIINVTGAEYRTVPIIGRAERLHTLLGQRVDLASHALTSLRDDLAEFVTTPAPTPPELDQNPPPKHPDQHESTN